MTQPEQTLRSQVVIGAGGVSVADVVAVARAGASVAVGSDAEAALERSHRLASSLVEGDRAVYGLSTGFGALAERYILPGERAALQAGLVRSHAATVGAEIETEVTRAMMLLRAATLAKGYSGVRADLVHGLAALLNAGLTPVVREHGSLGCSGDLAPLAHVALALIGEGEVVDPDGRRLPAAAALGDAGISPLVLEAKEGLALTNGTDGMLAMLCLACTDASLLLRSAEVAAAMSVEALLGTDQAFLPELAELRPHPGQAASAANMMAVLAGSEVVASHRRGDSRVQDAYSLRCAPQVLGAARDTLAHAAAVVERELASAIDNPVVLPDGRVASCGNFHGAPLGYVADFLAIALADAASIAERRVDRLLDPARSHGLPAFLAADPGVDSGLMLAQYSAAALVSDCRRLAVPASVDSIPTSAMQEDHVSMGWAAARKLRRVIANFTSVVGIEVMAAARAVELRAPLAPSPATAAVVAGLRRSVGGIGPDRHLAPEIDASVEAVASGGVVAWAESVTGPLG
ncbi:MAG: histidine ammonia-lyase [Acidimicrobiales bacterium]